jgi:hypothetical protein
MGFQNSVFTNTPVLQYSITPVLWRFCKWEWLMFQKNLWW